MLQQDRRQVRPAVLRRQVERAVTVVVALDTVIHMSSLENYELEESLLRIQGD